MDEMMKICDSFSWCGRNVAVTGASGFVGSHAALELRRCGAEVTALVRPSSPTKRLKAAGVICRVASLDDVADLTAALAGCEVVVHAAGAVGFRNDWEAYRRVNVGGTRNLAEAARYANVKRFVHVSSIVAVGAATTPTLLDETATWNLGRYGVPYITTKHEAEEAALAANGDRLEVVVVNPGGVIGPDDYSRSEFGILCRRYWRGRLPLHITGGNAFVDVRDVAVGIRLAAERGRAGERYLLTGENRTFSDFFGDLGRIAGKRIRSFALSKRTAAWIGYLNDKIPHPAKKRPYLTSSQAALAGLYFFFDAAKARGELGFTTRPFAETLRETHEFWIERWSEIKYAA